MTQEERFEEWCIVELMGHRRLAGKVSEYPLFGTNLLRIDIPSEPDEDGQPSSWTTQYYGGQAIYALTPTTEETVMRVAHINHAEPVSRWEMRRALEEAKDRVYADVDEDEDVW